MKDLAPESQAGQPTSDQQAGINIKKQINRVVDRRDEAERSKNGDENIMQEPEQVPAETELEPKPPKSGVTMGQTQRVFKLDGDGVTSVPDVQCFGSPRGTWELVCKTASESEGWMKSTRAMQIPQVGCLVNTSTIQRNMNGSYSLSEAVVFVPGVVVRGDRGGKTLVIQ